MSAKIGLDHNLTLAIAGKGLNTQDIVSEPELSTSIKKALHSWCESITQ